MGAGAGAMVGAMIGRNLVLLQEGCAAAETAWRPLIARGLTLVREPTSVLVPIPRGRPALTGTLQGHAVEVRVRSDAVHYAETEVIVTPAKPVGYRLGVWGSRGGVLGGIRDWLHGDVEVGDAAFDEKFLVTAEPASAAAEVLVPEQRERLRILIAGRFAGLVVEPERIKVVFSGVEIEGANLSVALDLALAVAG